MLKAFNSCQIVGIFVAFPHVISWLSTAQFAGSQVAMYTACILYFVSFLGAIALVHENL